MGTDTQYEDVIITKVEPNPSGWGLTFNTGWSFYCPPESPVVPAVGMTARMYGRGIGFPVRGLSIDGREVFYRTEGEEQERQRREADAYDAKQRADFEQARAAMDARVATLPGVFRERIQRFRANNPEFRWKYESYELFVCEEAVKIIDALKTPTAIREFAALSWDEQMKLVRLDGGHSGNTFGMAVRLALDYVMNPAHVKERHGALAPLVGSEEYGCVPRPPVLSEEG